MTNKQNIAVIGAGPMGLAVAYQLLKNGHRVTVFEADSVIGGMSAAFDFEGLRIERFYHFICTPDEPMFEMLRELGIENKLKWRETRMGYYLDGSHYAWGNPIALLKFPKLGLVSKLRYGLHAFLSTKRDDWRDLDKLESTTWIRRWIGDKAYSLLWKSLFDLKFYEYAHNLSAAWIWTRIKRVGSSRFSMMREKLGYLEGGSETLLEVMRQAIEEMGGEIRLSAPAERVLISDGTVKGVRIGGEALPFDQVISTVPTPYVPLIMPDLPPDVLEQFRALKNIAVVCVIVKLRKAVTKNFWLNVSDERMDIPGIVEYTNLCPLKEHVVYVPYYLPGEHPKYSESDEVFIEKTCNYLKILNPSLGDGDIIAVHASRYRYAQPICEPRYLETLPPIKLPVKGLYAADSSYYYPEDRGISESIRLGREIADMIEG